MDRWDGGEWFLMILMMALFLGAMAALVVWLVRSSRVGSGSGAPTAMESAERVLADRFARGEIDEEEFTRKRALLRAAPGK
jgi:putative membrane protein